MKPFGVVAIVKQSHCLTQRHFPSWDKVFPLECIKLQLDPSDLSWVGNNKESAWRLVHSFHLALS